MPIPNHCIDCDKVATVTLNDVPYCAECGIKNQQEDEDEIKHFMYREFGEIIQWENIKVS